jgi:hypothetical protein
MGDVRMKGTMIIFHPYKRQPQVIEFTREPTVAELKAGIGGGYLELVPGFRTIVYGNVVMDCVAFCDEDGKGRGLDVNNVATIAWDAALRRNGIGLLRPDGRPIDWLVGQVAVVFGDKEFMKAL